MLRFSGLAHVRSMGLLKRVGNFRAIIAVGALLTLGLVSVGSYMIISAADGASRMTPEHEIQVDTVEPVGSTVGNGDNVLYQIFGNTNYATATDVVVTVNVTNAVFDVLPDICKTESTAENPIDPISSIVNNTTLICNTGVWAAGSSFRIDVTARANGPNNGQVTMNTTIKSDTGAEVSASGTPKTISARFLADLGLYGGSNMYYDKPMAENTAYFRRGEGMVMPLYWRVAVGKGSERTGSANFTANLTLSNPTHADQAGFSGVVPFAGGACQQITSELSIFEHADLYRVNTPVAYSSGGQNNSNNGFSSCNIAGSGANYTLTVSGMDTSLNHVPTRAFRTGAGNYPSLGILPEDEMQYASGIVLIWVPNAWLDPGDTGRVGSVTATVSGYNPVSISGQGNTGEEAGNNSTTYTFLSLGSWNAVWNYNPLYGGTHTFLPGDTIRSVNAKYTSSYNSGHTTVLCEIVGPSYTFSSAFTGMTDNDSSNTTNDPRIRLEYSTAGLPPNRLAARCADSDGPWTTTPPTNQATVTRVRAIYTATPGDSTYITMTVDHKISNTAAIGTELWAYNMYSVDGGVTWPATSDMENSPSMCVTNLTGKQYSCTSSYHDYAYVVGAKVSLTKDTVNSKATYAVGEVVDYKIGVRTVQKADTMTMARVTDTLPKGMEYVPGSASLEPDSVTTNGAGATTIVWTVNDIEYNETREIAYQVRIVAETGVLTLTNSAVGALYNTSGGVSLDTRPASSRSVSDTINITSSGYVEITKEVEKAELKAEDDMVFVVTMKNHDANPHQYTDIIDILPYNGDNRTPASSYHGTLDKVSVDTNQRDAEIYYTTTDPSKLSNDPRDPSNGDIRSVDGNTVGWTKIKPRTGVTAVRAMGGLWTPEDGDVVVRLTFQRDGWVHGDVFSNDVGTVARSTILKMLSPNTVALIDDDTLKAPETGMAPVRQFGGGAKDKNIKGDNSMATGMGMLIAGAFIGLAGLAELTVFVLRRRS